MLVKSSFQIDLLCFFHLSIFNGFSESYEGIHSLAKSYCRLLPSEKKELFVDGKLLLLKYFYFQLSNLPAFNQYFLKLIGFQFSKYF